MPSLDVKYLEYIHIFAIMINASWTIRYMYSSHAISFELLHVYLEVILESFDNSISIFYEVCMQTIFTRKVLIIFTSSN